jgi:hypothetical protein
MHKAPDYTEALAALKACRLEMTKINATRERRYALEREAECLIKNIDGVTVLINARCSETHPAAKGQGIDLDLKR